MAGEPCAYVFPETGRGSEMFRQKCGGTPDSLDHDPSAHGRYCEQDQSGCSYHEYVDPAAPAPPRPLTQDDIVRRFTYHRPEGAKVGHHDDVRRHFKEFAEDLNLCLPGPSREASLAFTALEEASFWAHAAIARQKGTSDQ